MPLIADGLYAATFRAKHWVINDSVFLRVRVWISIKLLVEPIARKVTFACLESAREWMEIVAPHERML
jgi:hypothetical protein